MTAATGVPGLFTAATRANAEAGAATWATTLAAQKIEELRARPLLEAVAGESVDHLDQRGGPLDAPGSGSPAYTRRWWIEPLAWAPTDMLVVTVAVHPYRVGDGEMPFDTSRHRSAAQLVALCPRTTP